MEEQPKSKYKYIPIIAMAITLLLVPTAVGIGVWYYMDQQALKDKKAADGTVQDLQNQINDLLKEAAPAASNVFDFKSIKVGDKVAGMTVEKINRPDNWNEGMGGDIKFSGTESVRGEYQITTADAAIIGDNVCVRNLDANSLKSIPKEKNDGRSVWFCFTNKELAKKYLGPKTSGTSEMLISDYFITFQQSSVWNTATFVPPAASLSK